MSDLVRYHLTGFTLDGPEVADGVEVEVTLLATVKEGPAPPGRFLMVTDWVGPRPTEESERLAERLVDAWAVLRSVSALDGAFALGQHGRSASRDGLADDVLAIAATLRRSAPASHGGGETGAAASVEHPRTEP